MTRRRVVKLNLLALALSAAVFPGPAAAITPVASYKDVKVEPIEWTKPTPKTMKLKNGATLILLEDHRLPIVNFYGTVRAGGLYDPAGKAGTASLLGNILRTGGTKKRSWEKVDEEVDRLALAISTGIGNESGNASFEVLSENFVPALDLLFEMLREPAFDEEKIALAREKSKENIRRQNDNPLQIALREVRAILYGADHPRGFSPTFKTVDAITKQDLIDFHRKYYFPANMIIGVAGDFDAKKIASQIEKAMGTWPNQEIAFPEVPPLEVAKPRAIYLADKDNASQSTILVTKLTLKEGDPDQYALEVMDFILGSGGFTSRITEKVRSDRGLAYAAGSGLNIGKMDPGALLIYALSKSESTIEALDIMLKEAIRIGTEPVSQAELDKAKNSLLNGAVFDYDKPEKVIAETIDLSYYGMPEDLPERRLKALETVTAEDVQRVAQKYLPSDNLQILVVGAAAKFDKPLTTIGPVTTIEIKDPTLP